VSAIVRILPRDAVALEAFGEMGDGWLMPEEAAALGDAADVRRREFTTGRSLARRTLAHLGFSPVAIPRGASREPKWPLGVVGSITHCRGYCAAVVARAASVATIGIDAEIHAALPHGVLGKVSRCEERDWIATRRGDGVHWDRVLFSAKEAVFKAWFPVTRRWLGFDAASLLFHPDSATFTAHLVTERPVIDGRITSGFEGRYLLHDGYILTCVAVEAAYSASHLSATA
jgi:4'-phosphopantetheinyl transferase EntD